MSLRTLKFNCPSCHVALTTDISVAGQRGPCPACGEMILAPLPNSGASGLEPDPFQPRGPTSSPAKVDLPNVPKVIHPPSPGGQVGPLGRPTDTNRMSSSQGLGMGPLERKVSSPPRIVSGSTPPRIVTPASSAGTQTGTHTTATEVVPPWDFLIGRPDDLANRLDPEQERDFWKKFEQNAHLMTSGLESSARPSEKSAAPSPAQVDLNPKPTSARLPVVGKMPTVAPQAPPKPRQTEPTLDPIVASLTPLPLPSQAREDMAATRELPPAVPPRTLSPVIHKGNALSKLLEEEEDFSTGKTNEFAWNEKASPAHVETSAPTEDTEASRSKKKKVVSYSSSNRWGYRLVGVLIGLLFLACLVYIGVKFVRDRQEQSLAPSEGNVSQGAQPPSAPAPSELMEPIRPPSVASSSPSATVSESSPANDSSLSEVQLPKGSLTLLNSEAISPNMFGVDEMVQQDSVLMAPDGAGAQDEGLNLDEKIEEKDGGAENLLSPPSRNASVPPSSLQESLKSLPDDQDIRDAFTCVYQFLQAPTFKERSAYVRLSSKMSSVMERFYKRFPDGPYPYEKIRLHNRLVKEGGQLSFVFTCAHRNDGVLVEAPIQVEKEEGQWKVDWQTFSQFRHQVFQQFLSKTTNPEDSFHVTISRYHVFGELGPSNETHECFIVMNPPVQGQDEVMVFVKRNSDLSNELKTLLPWDNFMSLVAKIGWSQKNGRDGKPYLEFRAIKQPNWLPSID